MTRPIGTLLISEPLIVSALFLCHERTTARCNLQTCPLPPLCGGVCVCCGKLYYSELNTSPTQTHTHTIHMSFSVPHRSSSFSAQQTQPSAEGTFKRGYLQKKGGATKLVLQRRWHKLEFDRQVLSWWKEQQQEERGDVALGCLRVSNGILYHEESELTFYLQGTKKGKPKTYGWKVSPPPKKKTSRAFNNPSRQKKSSYAVAINTCWHLHISPLNRQKRMKKRKSG